MYLVLDNFHLKPLGILSGAQFTELASNLVEMATKYEAALTSDSVSQSLPPSYTQATSLFHRLTLPISSTPNKSPLDRLITLGET